MGRNTNTKNGQTAQPTVSAALVRMRIPAAANLGVDPQMTLRHASIESGALEKHGARITLEQENAIWRAIVTLSGDEHIGLRIGQSFRLAALGLLGYLLMNAETVGQAFQMFCRYERVIADTYRHTFALGDQYAHYRMEILGPWDPERKHTLDLSMTGAMTIAEEHASQRIPVRSANFRIAKPRNLDAYERALPDASLRFGCEYTEIFFDSNAAMLPIIGANRTLFNTFEAQVSEVHARLFRTESYSSKVRFLITEGMKGETPTISEVANRLATSVRNLQIKLRNEGTSFKQLVDECRRELATQFLDNGTASPAEIAYLLGFSEVGSFSRSFRRWMGVTPSMYLRDAHK